MEVSYISNVTEVSVHKTFNWDIWREVLDMKLTVLYVGCSTASRILCRNEEQMWHDAWIYYLKIYQHKNILKFIIITIKKT
jgi:hypothetical protein